VSTEALHAGDPAHPDHADFLLALGRATWEAASFAGARVPLDLDYWDLVHLPAP